jgi:hypothetical protein
MGDMGYLVGIVVVIVVICVVKYKYNIFSAKEKLEGTSVYVLALKIRDELQMKGYSSSEGCSFSKPDFYYYMEFPYGTIECKGPAYSGKNFTISFSVSKEGLGYSRRSAYNCHGIENDNIHIMVISTVFADNRSLPISQDMPEYIKIAAEVIENSGYGKSKQIEYADIV